MKITNLYFSPCGSTEKCSAHVAKTLAVRFDAEYQDDCFTLPQDRENLRIFGPDDLVVVSSPTYAGKLPNKIMPDFKEKIKAKGSKAIALTTFGNRSYDNSLAELVSILRENGFQIVAAAAIVNEHSFAHIAKGEPSEEEMARLEAFANSINLEQNVNVPGDADAPYYVPKREDGQPAKFLKAVSKTDDEKCTNCGLCAKRCPMGSISFENTSEITGVCIKCQACILSCKTGAKYFDDEDFKSHAKMLQRDFKELKKSEYFV